MLASAVLVLAGLNGFGRTMIEPMLPRFGQVTTLLDAQFGVTDVRVSQEGPRRVAQFRANLTHPLTIGGRTLYPFGSGGTPAVGFQVTISLESVLQSSAIMLIIALAWPVGSRFEYPVRIVLCVPLGAALALVEVPSTVLAELWNVAWGELDVAGVPALMIWSRFLWGGGGLVLGMGAAVIAIIGAQRSLGWLTRWQAGPDASPYRNTAVRN